MHPTFMGHIAEHCLRRIQRRLQLDAREVISLRHLMRRRPELNVDTLIFYVLAKRDILTFRRAARNAGLVARHIEDHGCLTFHYLGPKSASGQPTGADNSLHYVFRRIGPACPLASGIVLARGAKPKTGQDSVRSSTRQQRTLGRRVILLGTFRSGGSKGRSGRKPASRLRPS